MTRAHIFLTAFVLAASPVLARPIGAAKPLPPGHLLLDLSGFHLFHLQSEAPSPMSGSDGQASDLPALSLPRLAVGPLHAELGMDDNPRAGLSSYKLQGADQLGSSIWQAEQGRAAKLMFTWPTEK